MHTAGNYPFSGQLAQISEPIWMRSLPPWPILRVPLLRPRARYRLAARCETRQNRKMQMPEQRSDWDSDRRANEGAKRKAEAVPFLPRRRLFQANDHAEDRLLKDAVGLRKTGSPVKCITSRAQQIGMMFGAHVRAACDLLAQRTPPPPDLCSKGKKVTKVPSSNINA